VGQAGGGGLAKVPELDSSRFAKLVREAGLLDKSFDLTSADLIFAKVRRARPGVALTTTAVTPGSLMSIVN
jgi:hypothetical protein